MERPGARAIAPCDRCPYARPFPAGFDDCEAFQPLAYAPFDTHHEALVPVLTCGRMVVGEAGHRHYARCSLGTAADRAQVARGLRPASKVDEPGSPATS